MFDVHLIDENVTTNCGNTHCAHRIKLPSDAVILDLPEGPLQYFCSVKCFYVWIQGEADGGFRGWPSAWTEPKPAKK